MTGVSRAMFPTKALESYRGRGQLYSWLRAHHEAVAERLASDEATWPSPGRRDGKPWSDRPAW